MKKLLPLVIALCTLGLSACQSESESEEVNSTSTVSNECNRQCLESYVDQYLVALGSRDASLAPFSATVKHTENAKELPLSGATEGLWADAQEVEEYKFYIADIEAGQVAYIGFVQEAGAETASLLSMRLRIEHEEITEVESIVIRTVRENNKWAFTTPPAEFSQALTSDERVSREELIKISSVYFDGIEQFNSDLVPWHEECYRLENGMWTAGVTLPDEIAANMPELPSAPAGEGGGFGVFDRQACPVGFDSGGFAVIDNIQPRRTPVVDVERGVTWGIYMFNHQGVETITMPDGTTAPAPYFGGEPNSMPMSELFKIKGGEIRDIMAIGVINEYLSGSGWD